MQQELTTLEKFNILAEISCKSKATIKSYHRHIDRFIKKYGENAPQDKIIDYLYYLKTERKYDNSSLHIAKYSLLYYFKEILRQEITVKIPKISRKKGMPKPLNKSVIKKLISITKNFKHKLLLEMAYDTGLRPFELVGIEWEWIDIENKQGIINNGKGNKDGFFYFSDMVAKHLLQYKGEQEKRLKAMKIIPKYVFDSLYKPEYHISKRTYEQVMKNSAKKANIGLKVYCYRMRHSFGSHLEENGTPLEEIQPRMRHNSIKTTLNYVRIGKPKVINNPLDDIYFNDMEITHNIA